MVAALHCGESARGESPLELLHARAGALLSTCNSMFFMHLAVPQPHEGASRWQRRVMEDLPHKGDHDSELLCAAALSSGITVYAVRNATAS